MPRSIALLVLCCLQSGCYYMQAVSGQWEVMQKREPIDEVIANPETTEELAARLRLLSAARDFSISELGLPDNQSYRSYADLERDYVVWNVLAAPEFSLQPKQWCFPVAGCVSYRGYFSKDAAMRASKRLSKQGYDVAVGGVAAYSTLGNFSDPILNTMMHWDDRDLVALLFHELAHQVVYARNDSAFNESFASAVEKIGLQRWLDANDRIGDDAEYAAREARQDKLADVLRRAREDLQTLYASDADEASMRQAKAARFDQLADEIQAIRDEAGPASSAGYNGELNNAHLVTSGLYEGLVPQFEGLFDACGQSLPQFYGAAEYLADLEKAERDRLLALPAGDLLCFGSGPDD
jgi:predicted aminopeptidase